MWLPLAGRRVLPLALLLSWLAASRAGHCRQLPSPLLPRMTGGDCGLLRLCRAQQRAHQQQQQRLALAAAAGCTAAVACPSCLRAVASDALSKCKVSITSSIVESVFEPVEPADMRSLCRSITKESSCTTWLLRHQPGQSMQLRVLESECRSLVRREMRALQSDNLRTVMQQIRREPHAVYGALKGRPKPLPLSMQTADLWEPYVEKLAACDHEYDLQSLNSAAAAFQPSPPPTSHLQQRPPSSGWTTGTQKQKC